MGSQVSQCAKKTHASRDRFVSAPFSYKARVLPKTGSVFWGPSGPRLDRPCVAGDVGVLTGFFPSAAVKQVRRCPFRFLSLLVAEKLANKLPALAVRPSP